MKCEWQELLAILPERIAREVDRHGRVNGQEIRLRLGAPPELIRDTDAVRLPGRVEQDDLNFCVNTASRYSPWTAQTMSHGYITAPGGHRIGLCGEAIVKNLSMAGINRVTSLCIRVARDFPGIARDAAGLEGSLLLIGPPGSGKTTLLRDLARQISAKALTAVIDERRELFPEGMDRGNRLDVLQGCPKAEGMDILIRTMGPAYIALDEITAKADCDALLQAAWCGVRILATAHAGSIQELKKRPLYRPILESGIFDYVLVLNRDKSWRKERVCG